MYSFPVGLSISSDQINEKVLLITQFPSQSNPSHHNCSQYCILVGNRPIKLNKLPGIFDIYSALHILCKTCILWLTFWRLVSVLFLVTVTIWMTDSLLLYLMTCKIAFWNKQKKNAKSFSLFKNENNIDYEPFLCRHKCERALLENLSLIVIAAISWVFLYQETIG